MKTDKLRRRSARTYLVLSAVLLAALGPLAKGQDSTSIVEAPRYEAPATAHRIGTVEVSAKELRETGERSLPKAIGRATGVWIQETNLGGGSAFIRGLTGNQVLILVDGVRLNDSTTRFGPNQSLNSIDPAIVERVQVLRGPSSVLYGSDAIGGVISVWTRRKRPHGDANRELELGAFVRAEGNTASEGGRISLGVEHASENWGGVVVGTRQEWNDLRAGGGEDVDFTGYDGNGFFASEEVRLEEGRSLRASARVTRDFNVPRTDRLIVGFGQTEPANERFEFELQERQNFLLNYEDRLGNAAWDSLDLRFSVSQTEELRDRIRTNSTTRRREGDEVDSIGVSAEAHRAAGDSQLLTYGFDFYRDEVDSFRRNTDLVANTTTAAEGQFAPNSEYSSLGVFLRDEWFVSDEFDLTAGLRYSLFDFSFDRFASQGGGSEDGDFSAVTGSLQAAWQASERLRVYANVAQGFRAPNLDDLAKDGSFAGGTELANANLDAEESLTGEFAVEWNQPGFGAALAVYHTGISDLVGRRLTDEGAPGLGDETYRRENVGSASIFGVEFEFDAALGQSDFSIEAALAYQRGDQFDQTVDPNTGDKPFNDVPIRRIPPLHGRLGLQYQPELNAGSEERSGWRWARIESLFAATQNRLHPNDLSDPRIDPAGTDGWVILNLDVGGDFITSGDTAGHSTWSLGLHNVADTRYRVHGSGFDAPGIHLVAGLALHF